MRSSKSRSRSKSNRNRSMGNIVNRVFESSGPEGKVRGTPQQIIDKYTQLARDAQLSNDRVALENFQQHAEYYTRMLGEAQREADARREQQEQQNRDRQQRERDEGRGDSVDPRGQDGPDQRGDVERHGGADRQPMPERAAPQDRSGGGDSRADGQMPVEASAVDAPAQTDAGKGPVDVLDLDPGGDSGLVDTPEDPSPKPKPRKPRARKPKVETAPAPAEAEASKDGEPPADGSREAAE